MPFEFKGGHGKLPRDLRDKRNVNPHQRLGVMSQ